MANPALTIPLFRAPLVLDAARVTAAFAARWPDDPPPDVDEHEGTLALTAVGLRCAASARPNPVPGDEVARVAAVSWRWPTAAADLAGYGAHAVVFAPAADDRIQPFMAATRVTAAVLAATDALGVYVGGAGMVVPARTWVEEATTALPIGLWLNTGVSAGAGWSAAYTAGMGQFGLPDVELVWTGGTAEAARSRALEVALHAVVLGPLPDGARVGDDVVRVVPSGLDRPGDVYRVER